MGKGVLFVAAGTTLEPCVTMNLVDDKIHPHLQTDTFKAIWRLFMGGFFFGPASNLTSSEWYTVLT